MNGRRDIAEPGELVYPSRSSWAPVFFAFAAALALTGVFSGGFMLPGWVWSAIGVVVLLATMRSMVRGAIRAHFRLPRRQRARGAVLPVEPIEFPPS